MKTKRKVATQKRVNEPSINRGKVTIRQLPTGVRTR
jgi:hypothetical protein